MHARCENILCTMKEIADGKNIFDNAFRGWLWENIWGDLMVRCNDGKKENVIWSLSFFVCIWALLKNSNFVRDVPIYIYKFILKVYPWFNEI